MKLLPRLVFALLAAGFLAVAQTKLNLSEDLVALGIASKNMVPDEPTLDAGPLLFQGVSYAQTHQIGLVIADTGAYYFQSLQFAGAHVAWDKLNSLTIDLQGSDLYFSHPLVGGMIITNSTNLVLENFTADYNPLPFTQVRVVSVNPAQQSIQFAVDGNWQNPSVLNQVFPAIPNAYGYGIEVHIFRNGRPIPGVTRMYAANPVGTAQFTANPDPGVNPSAMFALIRPGDIAYLGMRAGCGPAPSALAYVLNATVVPSAPFGYLTLWAQAQPQPLAAVLNAIDGAITSNLAITPTQNGIISAFASDPTQLVLDVFGYFAP